MTFEPVASPNADDAAEALARLGPALIDSGAVDPRTLERARRVASETGGRLDRVLTQLGLISERGLAEALAQLVSTGQAAEIRAFAGAGAGHEKGHVGLLRSQAAADD